MASCRSWAGEDQALLKMPPMRGDTHIGHFQKRFAGHLRNLEAIAPGKLHAGDEPFQCGAERLLTVKSEDGALDLPSHEEKGPSLDFLVKRPGVLQGRPSTRIRFAFERHGVRQLRAFLNQNAPRCEC